MPPKRNPAETNVSMTPDPVQLPHLIRLLEDESPMVQAAVWRELKAYGSELDEELTRQNLSIGARSRDRWRELEDENNRSALLMQWPSCFEIEGEKEQLETAFSLLSDYRNGYTKPDRLSKLLDALALEFRKTEEISDGFELARFLFQTKGLSGGRTDYYTPDKSDLARVIENRSGNPISLTCIYMLVGHRLGIEIQGCNFPGHFLGRTLAGNELRLVDCFDGGRFIRPGAFRDLGSASPEEIRELVHRPASVETILTRVLNNLINAYDAAEDPENSGLMRELNRMLLRYNFEFGRPQ